MSDRTTSDAGPRVLDPGEGASQTGLRAHNERLLLSLVRRHGSLPKAEIARRTKLSAQTVSVIMRSLEADGLLMRLQPVRGKVGQPSVPMALNPDGAFSIGLKIGRRSADIVLLDLVGTIRERSTIRYGSPQPSVLRDFLHTELKALLGGLSSRLRNRIVGVGFGEPFEVWNWFDPLGAPPVSRNAWRSFDPMSEIAKLTRLPVLVENDATAACCAEHIFGRGREFSHYVYFFVGYFVGGGIVLDHAVYRGRTGRAGALGSMPLHGDGQLIDRASLFTLEKMLLDAKMKPVDVTDELKSWNGFGAYADRWISETATGLASAAASASAVIDFEAVVIDGSLPPEIRTRLVAEVAGEMARLDTRGIARPSVVEGTIGYDARAIGAASLPFQSNALLD